MNLKEFKEYYIRHNPYFNRWFSAIHILQINICLKSIVTILILIDGFLQYKTEFLNKYVPLMSQSLF